MTLQVDSNDAELKAITIVIPEGKSEGCFDLPMGMFMHVERVYRTVDGVMVDCHQGVTNGVELIYADAEKTQPLYYWSITQNTRNSYCGYFRAYPDTDAKGVTMLFRYVEPEGRV